MLYLLNDMPLDLSVRVIDPREVGNKYPQRFNIARMDIPHECEERRFVAALKIIKGGEAQHRKRIEEILKKRSRNLKTAVGSRLDYLNGQMGGREMKYDNEALEKLLTDAFQPLRAELGWPEKNTTTWAYQITERAIDAATSDKAKGTLRQTVPFGILFQYDLNRLEERLKVDAPDDVKNVMKVVRGTVSRDHLALISLTANGEGELVVKIVNDDKKRLFMPAWKLVDLIEHAGATRKVFTFPEYYNRERNPAVVFNQEAVGDVVGEFDPAQGLLTVMTFQGSAKKPTSGRTEFYLDPDYLLALWVVLKRTREDSRRYQELLEMAEAEIDYRLNNLR